MDTVGWSRLRREYGAMDSLARLFWDRSIKTRLAHWVFAMTR
ncbi:hypothetical protein SAMN05421837_11059 [Amycolatopsis pretoriensis]|uniref:Uncharacterized protein n=1 Tax=Amycolatopsis pretoriensis TaxID=218821 RepID=A0A1H5RD70_9PSEU|nr:hypothetical protein SAMN05421837_11059 [Amycolatopsis pretoriensis]